MHRFCAPCGPFASAPVSPMGVLLVTRRALMVPLSATGATSSSAVAALGSRRVVVARRGFHQYSRSAPTVALTVAAAPSALTFASTIRPASSSPAATASQCSAPSLFWHHHHQRRFKSNSTTEAAATSAATTGASPANGGDVSSSQWREYWDMKEKAPYYHSLVTNETTNVCPVGFKSEYVGYYARVAETANHNDHNHHETPAAAAATPKTPDAEASGKKTGSADETKGDGQSKTTKAKTLKERVKEYGPAGVALYLVIHFTSASIIFIAMVFGVDVTAIARKVGFDVHAEGTSWPALWVAAVLVNKLFVPIQAAVTLALAPKVTPLLRRLLARFGIGVHKAPASVTAGAATSGAAGGAGVKPPPTH